MGEAKLAKVQSESEEIEKVRDEMEANEGEMEEKIENLEEGIRETKRKNQVNLSREGEAGEREDLNEEKVAFLERELKETTMRAEAAERMSMVLYNSNVEVNTECHKWITQREEMLANMFTMDDVADDPAYNCFNIVAGAGSAGGEQ